MANMALDPREILRRRPPDDDLPRAPLAGTRRQRFQRLQVGFFGLGAMVLLVGLANIIMSGAQQSQATAVVEELPAPIATGDVPAPRDPLADAGVAPDLPAESVPTGAAPAQVPGDVPPPPPIN